jgi:hypothetical protein
VRGIHLAAQAVDENAEQVGPPQGADRARSVGTSGALIREAGDRENRGAGSHPSSLRARYDGLISTDPAITGELAEERPGNPGVTRTARGRPVTASQEWPTMVVGKRGGTAVARSSSQEDCTNPMHEHLLE